jgi:AraC-like DNA-binding protein
MKETAISLLSVLLLLGSAQGIFLALLLLRFKKGNLHANRWLACLLFLFSITLIDGFLTETRYYLLFPHLIAVEWPLNLAIGPLLFLYVRSLTGLDAKGFRISELSHFIPVIILYILLTPFYVIPPELKTTLWLESINETTANPLYHIDPVLILIVLQVAVYWGISIKMISRYAKRIKENFSDVETICLSWLRNLLIIFFIIFVIYLFTYMFSGFFGLYDKAEFFIHLVLAIIIYAMGIKGLSHPEIFTVFRASDAEGEGGQFKGDDSKPIEYDVKSSQKTENEQGKKYQKSSLTDEQAMQIVEKLSVIMENEKPFLETGLTLTGLANMLSISPNHLSQVINEKTGKSFFEFVNEYRVEEAKRLLVSPLVNRFSVLGIGMESGFSSKSAFYNAFKKHTGVTPSGYKDQYQQQEV